MIDTDKYEGHLYENSSTRHPVQWYDDDSLFDVVYFCIDLLTDDRTEAKEATAALLDDAPLILEEVKRLREENELLRQGIIDACSTASSGAKRPVADGSIKHYFPLYLREMIE